VEANVYVHAQLATQVPTVKSITHATLTHARMADHQFKVETPALAVVHNSTLVLSAKLSLTSAQLNHVKMVVLALLLAMATHIPALAQLATLDPPVKSIIHAITLNAKMVVPHRLMVINASASAQHSTAVNSAKLITMLATAIHA